MKRNIVTFLPIAIIVASGLIFSNDLSAKKKAAALPKVELKGAAKDSADFHKTLDEAKVYKGMFNAYMDKKGKLTFELPDSAFAHTYLLVNRVNSLSQTMITSPVRWQARRYLLTLPVMITMFIFICFVRQMW